MSEHKANVRTLEFTSILRDRSRWPEGFEWAFINPCRCAMGLFHALTHGGKMAESGKDIDTTALGDHLGVDRSRAYSILMCGAEGCSPEAVADALERAGTR